jgi:hypothetical protein
MAYIIGKYAPKMTENVDPALPIDLSIGTMTKIQFDWANEKKNNV